MKVKFIMDFYRLENHGNIGDNFVQLGSHFLFEMCGHEVFYEFIAKGKFDWMYKPYPTDDVDLNVVIGTPWLWHGCERTDKYRRLEKIVKRCDAPLIAFGIGSNVPLPVEKKATILYRPNTIKKCREIWGQFDLLVCRDPVAQDFFSDIGLDAITMSCPSIFLLDFLRSKNVPIKQSPDWQPSTKTALVWIDMKQYPYLSEERKRWCRGVLDNHKKDYRVMIERNSYHTHYFHPTWNDLGEYAAKMLSFDTIYSFRIHQVIPFATETNVSVVPIDGRSETTKFIGIPNYPETGKVTGKRAILSKYKKILEEL